MNGVASCCKWEQWWMCSFPVFLLLCCCSSTGQSHEPLRFRPVAPRQQLAWARFASITHPSTPAWWGNGLLTEICPSLRGFNSIGPFLGLPVAPKAASEEVKQLLLLLCLAALLLFPDDRLGALGSTTLTSPGLSKMFATQTPHLPFNTCLFTPLAWLDSVCQISLFPKQGLHVF